MTLHLRYIIAIIAMNSLKSTHVVQQRCLLHRRTASRLTTASASHSPHFAGQRESSETPSSSSLVALSRWLENQGGAVDGLSLQDCPMGPATVRGLAATRELPPSTTLLRVPLRCTIRDTSCPEAYPGAAWNVSMAVFLLGEVAQHRRHQGLQGHAEDSGSSGSGSSSSVCDPASSSASQLNRGGKADAAAADSRWWPYIASMPGIYDGSPLLFNEQQLAEVQHGPAIGAITLYQAFARQAYDEWTRFNSQGGADSGAALSQTSPYDAATSTTTTAAAVAAAAPHSSLPSWLEFCWALHMVQSRSIRLAIKGCKVLIPGTWLRE